LPRMLCRVLAVLQVVYVLLNIVGGPCSCEGRLHFPVQVSGLVCATIYLIMSNTAVSHWPEGAQVWSPRVYFNVSAILMTTGQTVLTWGAYHLSGAGCGRAYADEEARFQRRLVRLKKCSPRLTCTEHSLASWSECICCASTLSCTAGLSAGKRVTLG